METRTEELSRTLFPLGNITKEEIKTYVLQKGFKEKVEKKESMEVCFIENDYRDFLLQQIPNLNEVIGKGFFVDKKGKKLGLHKGFPFYTIGQRKGLEIALGHPAYVIKINPYKNTIRLGDKEDLLTTEMLLQISSYKHPYRSNIRQRDSNTNPLPESGNSGNSIFYR